MSSQNKIRFQCFCKAQTGIPLFMHPGYLDAVVGATNWDVALVERQEQIIAALPFLLSESPQPALIPRLGPYLIPEFQTYERQHKYLFHLIDQLPDTDFFHQRFHPGITNWLPFYWNGFQQTTYYTYQVDLTRSMEAIYNSMNPDYRLNKISNARRFVRTVFNRSLEDVYNLYLKDQQQRQRPVVPFDNLERLYQYLTTTGQCQLFCTVDGLHQLQSACILIWDQQTAYVLLHAIQPDTAYPDANIIILWEAMHYTRNILKLPTFDLLNGMDKADEQLYRGFGTQQIPYFVIQKKK